MSRKVAVLMGGWSSEREVSLSSGANCTKALRALGHEVVAIDVNRNLAALLHTLDEAKPDIVFNALHGRYGEDGCIQGVLDILELPYTHSGLLASALAMNKPMAKRLFEAAGLRCPDGRVVSREELSAGDPFPRPYVVKPINEGSSVGVQIVEGGDNEAPFEGGEWPYGERVLVEEYIPGREITVSAMEDRALGVTELRAREGFYDYEAKYTEGKTEHLIPAPVPDSIADEARKVAVKAHTVLGCRGVSRADFRYDDTGRGDGVLYLLEVNTQPGMTPLSLVPEQAAHAGYGFEELVGWILEQATCDR